MKQILIIEASPRGENSASRAVSDTLAARLGDLHPSARILRRDLTAEPLPHLDEVTLRAISTKDPAEAERLKEVAGPSDRQIDELLESDLLVIATPMLPPRLPIKRRKVSRPSGSAKTVLIPNQHWRFNAI